MSSGNPFRASQSYAQSPFPPTSFGDSDNSVLAARRGDSDHVFSATTSTPPKTKKQVRIVSPTASIPPHPDAFDAYEANHDPVPQSSDYAQWSSSPGNSAFAASPAQSAAAGLRSVQDAPGGHDMAAASISSTPTTMSLSQPQMASPSSNVPVNPFARTLASLESPEPGIREDRTSAEGTAPGNSKASLDVESFKNLLLTGKPTPVPSAQPAQVAAPITGLTGPQFESSSSTDTSSISRQSLFEQSHEVHAESPRTSLDIVESEEDENMGLVSEVPKGKKKPPPAPKHRHGKLVVPRQPQTVSFDDFAASEPSPSPVTRPRENSETSKPLPPIPGVSSSPPHISTQENTQLRPPPTPSKQRSSSAEGELPTQQTTQPKKTPPPVPLARRQSQMRSSSDGNRSRSNSSLTMSSQYSIDPLSSPLPSNTDPLSVAKSPPPPPPRSRHGARLANISTSSANSSNTELPSRAGSVRDTVSVSNHRASLGAIERSEPSSPVLGVHRTSSVSSTRNSMRAVSGESTGSISMPPPPPPPRRRQSNRSSLDQPRPGVATPTESRRTSTEYRRTSTEYRRTSLDSKRRTSAASESSLRKEYAPVDSQGVDENALYSPREESENTLDSETKTDGTRSDSTNILDDMEKFQREIDELRNRYKQVG